jgi:hypothetical protein
MRRLRTLVLAAVIGGATILGPAVPAHALDCAPGVFTTVCTAVFGTYCKLTHRSPCFP